MTADDYNNIKAIAVEMLVEPLSSILGALQRLNDNIEQGRMHVTLHSETCIAPPNVIGRTLTPADIHAIKSFVIDSLTTGALTLPGGGS